MDYRPLLGDAWSDMLPKAPELLEPIRERLAEEKKLGIVIYPARENIFRIFRDIPPEKVRVLWIGQDPYHSPAKQATGRSFECGVRVSPSWRKISEIYRKEVVNWNQEVVSGKLDRWVNSGVFLLNKALTVREKMPNSHSKLWEPFTAYVISCLLNDLVNPKAIVLLGNEAKKIIPKAPSPHKIFAYEHPIASMYQNRPWLASGLFKEVQDFLHFHEIDFNW